MPDSKDKVMEITIMFKENGETLKQGCESDQNLANLIQTRLLTNFSGLVWTLYLANVQMGSALEHWVFHHIDRRRGVSKTNGCVRSCSHWDTSVLIPFETKNQLLEVICFALIGFQVICKRSHFIQIETGRKKKSLSVAKVSLIKNCVKRFSTIFQKFSKSDWPNLWQMYSLTIPLTNRSDTQVPKTLLEIGYHANSVCVNAPLLPQICKRWVQQSNSGVLSPPLSPAARLFCRLSWGWAGGVHRGPPGRGAEAAWRGRTCCTAPQKTRSVRSDSFGVSVTRGTGHYLKGERRVWRHDSWIGCDLYDYTMIDCTSKTEVLTCPSRHPGFLHMGRRWCRRSRDAVKHILWMQPGGSVLWHIFGSPAVNKRRR